MFMQFLTTLFYVYNLVLDEIVTLSLVNRISVIRGLVSRQLTRDWDNDFLHCTSFP